MAEASSTTLVTLQFSFRLSPALLDQLVDETDTVRHVFRDKFADAAQFGLVADQTQLLVFQLDNDRISLFQAKSLAEGRRDDDPATWTDGHARMLGDLISNRKSRGGWRAFFGGWV